MNRVEQPMIPRLLSGREAREEERCSMQASRQGATRERRLRRLASWATTLALWVGLCQLALAAGGGKPAHKLVHVADTRAMGTGVGKWIADIYNTSYWGFSAAVVVVMVGMGLLLGLFSDRIISLLGINLGKMSHHE